MKRLGIILGAVVLVCAGVLAFLVAHLVDELNYAKTQPMREARWRRKRQPPGDFDEEDGDLVIDYTPTGSEPPTRPEKKTEEPKTDIQS